MNDKYAHPNLHMWVYVYVSWPSKARVVCLDYHSLTIIHVQQFIHTVDYHSIPTIYKSVFYIYVIVKGLGIDTHTLLFLSLSLSHTHTHAHTHTRTRTHAHAHARAHIHAHAHVHTLTHIHIHTPKAVCERWREPVPLILGRYWSIVTLFITWVDDSNCNDLLTALTHAHTFTHTHSHIHTTRKHAHRCEIRLLGSLIAISMCTRAYSYNWHNLIHKCTYMWISMCTYW